MPYCHDSHVGPHAATASKHGHNVIRTPPLHPNMATTSCTCRPRLQTRPQHHAHAATASKYGHNIIRTPPLRPNTATTSSARRPRIQTWPQHQHRLPTVHFINVRRSTLCNINAHSHTAHSHSRSFITHTPYSIVLAVLPTVCQQFINVGSLSYNTFFPPSNIACIHSHLCSSDPLPAHPH